MEILIKQAKLYDPLQGWHARAGDLGVRDGRIVAAVQLGSAPVTIDARGGVVVPAAIDAAAHAAFFGVHLARASFDFPTAFEIGRRYVERGYCHVHELFLSPVTALSVHAELDRIPWLDTSVSLALPLYDLEPWLAEAGEDEAAKALVPLVEHLGILGFYATRAALRHRLEVYRHKDHDAERLLPFVRRLADRLGGPLFVAAHALPPDALHLVGPPAHLVRLAAGLPDGDAESTAALQAVLDSRASLDLGLPWNELSLCAGWWNGNRQPRGLRWDFGFENFFELFREDGRDFRSHAPTMELMAADRLQDAAVLSAGHANMALVEDWRGFLEAVFHCWSPDRFLTATRSVPARILGLRDRGTLRPGSWADIAIHPALREDSPAAWAETFSRCSTLLIRGRIVVHEGHLVTPREPGKRWRRRSLDGDHPDLDWLEDNVSLRRQTLGRPATAAGGWMEC